MSQTQIPFILHPKNQAFMQGESQYPYTVFRSARPIFIFLGLLLLAPVLVYTLYGYGSLRDYLDFRAIENSETRTEGVVASGAFKNDESGESYHVFFSYTVNGQSYQAQSRVEQMDFIKANPGMTVTVKYLADTPEKAQLDSAINVYSPRTFVGGVVLAVVVIVGMAFVATWFDRRRLHELKGGQYTGGEVVSCRRDADNPALIHLEYRFSLDGESLTGSDSEESSDFKTLDLPEPGRVVRVFYLSNEEYQVL